LFKKLISLQSEVLVRIILLTHGKCLWITFKSDAEFLTLKLAERFHIKHLHFHQNWGCHRSVRLQGLFCRVLFGLFLVLNGIRIGLGDTHSVFPLGGKLMRVHKPFRWARQPFSHSLLPASQQPGQD